MTRKTINNRTDIADKHFKKLSIQVSLNGLSFCVADTVTQHLIISDAVVFSEEMNPMTLQAELVKLFKKHNLEQMAFDEVITVHRNTLFGLVPKSLFNEDNLLEYLKFNTKVLANDVLAYDEVENQDLIIVYVPYMNVNNYIYDLFGEFTYMHNSTVLLQSLMNNLNQDQEPVCYIHVKEVQMDVTVLNQRKLILYNSFTYSTKEDFIYYVLFVLEQLNLDPKTTNVKVFGTIDQDDPIFQLCHTYIKHLSIFTPTIPSSINMESPFTSTMDFTLINTL
ncbi:DUF3822 family protein [Maribacter sp. MAR_2009_72]|uniref:DUF3822 family protein n=1 Tax=Maribacter sp. MAR_2009_72 TaxID=1250050 RepID=UPI00119A1E46|nr:DUF3822 family protein [Maribacter sp. MAR_2009_72]TVZ14971.1 uncharacterized protein DUF3822 [Maribacter sp. MAR_2009_72]